MEKGYSRRDALKLIGGGGLAFLVENSGVSEADVYLSKNKVYRVNVLRNPDAAEIDGIKFSANDYITVGESIENGYKVFSPNQNPLGSGVIGIGGKSQGYEVRAFNGNNSDLSMEFTPNYNGFNFPNGRDGTDTPKITLGAPYNVTDFDTSSLTNVQKGQLKDFIGKGGLLPSTLLIDHLKLTDRVRSEIGKNISGINTLNENNYPYDKIPVVTLVGNGRIENGNLSIDVKDNIWNLDIDSDFNKAPTPMIFNTYFNQNNEFYSSKKVPGAQGLIFLENKRLTDIENYSIKGMFPFE